MTPGESPESGFTARGARTVDLDDTPEQAEYRAQVRGWL